MNDFERNMLKDMHTSQMHSDLTPDEWRNFLIRALEEGYSSRKELISKLIRDYLYGKKNVQKNKKNAS
jgi:hypothetical protein